MPNSSVSESPRLFCLRGKVSGADLAFPLTSGCNRVGSSSFNQVLLSRDGVSRRHADLLVEPERLFVIDRRSTNGTFVNKSRVHRTELSVGDEIAFGPAKLRLERQHPEEAKLAVEIPPEPPNSLSFLKEPSTAIVNRSPELHARWLQLTQRFLRQLRPTPRGAIVPALALLVKELPVSGACIFEVIDDRRPTLLAAYGKVEGESFENLMGLWKGQCLHREKAPGTRSMSRLFASTKQATGLLSVERERSIGVGLLGDFPSRGESQDLLAAILTVCQPESEGERQSPSTHESTLAFPPDYAVGTSAPMTALYDEMRILAPGDLPLLIVGETGVGKELIARSLHLSSPRRNGPFIAVNCAAIPSELLEAELFGIGDRVASGVAGRKGVFQRAEGGTLVLDEIGEMPCGLQAKLLRVLQERQLQPLGSKPIPLDVRVVAVTNSDILALMDQGRFRRDLYFRIAGFVLNVPPLRERREDIPLLVERFLHRFSLEIGKPARGMTVRALRALKDRDWPGNVRELEHEIHRLVYLCPPKQAIESRMLTNQLLLPERPEEHCPRSLEGTHTESSGRVWKEQPVSGRSELRLDALEREAVREALRRTRGNQVQAAKLLGISRYGLRRRVDRHQLND